MTDLPFQIDADSFAKPHANTLIDYMYRDASNYKQSMTAVLPGVLTLEQAVALCNQATGGGEDGFRPDRVGLDMADWSSEGDGAHYEDDHPWHELTGVALTDAAPTVEIDAQTFAVKFEQASLADWNDTEANAEPYPDQANAVVLAISSRQYDALLAGLRLLARDIDKGLVEPNDGDVGDILTCAGAHAGLSAEQIHAFGDALQKGEHDIAR